MSAAGVDVSAERLLGGTWFLGPQKTVDQPLNGMRVC